MAAQQSYGSQHLYLKADAPFYGSAAKRLAARLLCKQACGLMFLLCVMLYCPAAQAACPNGNFTLYSPTSQNSQTDLLFRLLPPFWQGATQERLTVASAPGKGGSYAINKLFDAKSDGCSVAGLQMASFFQIAQTSSSMYADKDVTIAGIFAAAPSALWIDETSTITTVYDFVQHARQEAEMHGRIVVIAGMGSYTDHHLATFQLNRYTGIATRYLPVLGTQEAAENVKSNNALACWGYALSPDTMSGMRPLAIAAEARSPVLPDVPTFRELGFEIINTEYFGIGVASSTPEDIVNALKNAIQQCAVDANLQAQLSAIGFTPIPMTDKELQPFIAACRSAATAWIKEFGFVPQDLIKK